MKMNIARNFDRVHPVGDLFQEDVSPSFSPFIVDEYVSPRESWAYWNPFLERYVAPNASVVAKGNANNGQQGQSSGQSSGKVGSGVLLGVVAAVLSIL